MSTSHPFRCPSCSQSFTRSGNLERHKKTRHGARGFKTFECTLCHTIFNRVDICKRHRERCDGQPSSKRGRRTEILIESESATVEAEANVRSHDSPPTSPPAPSPSPQACPFPEDSVASCVTAYFANFHSNFPILHRPTFSLTSTPKPLMDIVVAIGNLYRCRIDLKVDVESAQRQSNKLWEAAMRSLQGVAISDPGKHKDNWIIQASLLCVVYGTFSAEQFSQSRQMLAGLVSDIRKAGLFNQHMSMHFYAAWRQEIDSGMSLGPRDLDETWLSFVNEECLKLCLYGVTLIDFHLVLACNLRAEVSPLELVWALPWSKQCWEANTANDWWQHISLEAARYQNIDCSMSDRGVTMKSMFLATQSLLSDTPSSSLLQALSSSPFALYCVTANIYRLVRGFTHCLYQLPPNPSNPSPFHLLTHSQNSQITSALKTILGLRNNDGSMSSSDDGLWTAVKISCWVTKISLCVPDDFLICGIVDTDISAAFATAAHLSLGNQVLGRRSRNAISTPRAFGEEGFLLIFEELMNAMNAIVCADAQAATREAPWVSIMNFRVLLDLSRVLRLATADVNERIALHGMSGMKNFDHAQVVYTTVRDALARHIRNKKSLLTNRDLEQLGLLELTDDPKACERKFMMLMIQCCNERNVWAVGRTMAMVLDEISAGIQS